MSKAKKALEIYKRYGFFGFCNKLSEKMKAPYRDYNDHVAEFLPDEGELSEQRKRQESFVFRPKISIVVPTYETPDRFLLELLDSVRTQTYPKWELVIPDGSESKRVALLVKKYMEKYPDFARNEAAIRYRKLPKNGGISVNTNAGLKLCTGAYIGFMDHDDVLTPNALFEVVDALNQQRYRLLYSDEDKANETLTYFEQPHFKKDFDLELLRTNNYICHFLVIDAALVLETGGLRREYDGSQDYDLVLRAVERLVFPDGRYHPEGRDKICHIPKILYHWRMHEGSTAFDSASKGYTVSAGQWAVETHFKRLGIRADVKERLEIGCYQIRYADPEDLRLAEKEIKLYVAEGLKPRGDDWKAELLRTCMQEGVGAVVGKTYQKNGTIDQCGLALLPDGKTEKLFHGMKGSFKGYARRAVLKQETEAIEYTFAAVRESVLCRAGSRIIFDPDAEADWIK